MPSKPPSQGPRLKSQNPTSPTDQDAAMSSPRAALCSAKPLLIAGVVPNRSSHRRPLPSMQLSSVLQKEKKKNSRKYPVPRPYSLHRRKASFAAPYPTPTTCRSARTPTAPPSHHSQPPLGLSLCRKEREIRNGKRERNEPVPITSSPASESPAMSIHAAMAVKKEPSAPSRRRRSKPQAHRRRSFLPAQKFHDAAFKL